MNFIQKIFLGIFVFCSLSLQLFASPDTLRVMYYNVLNFPGNTSNRVTYFRQIMSYAKPDVLLISELISDEGAQLLLNDGLNSGGQVSYQKAAFTNGNDSENMLYYNHDKVALYSQDTIVTALRLINEYVLFYHCGNPLSTDTTFFYFYSAHLKASSGSVNRQKRLEEVMLFKQHLLNHPEAKNIFFGGDLNFYSFTEPAYDALTSAEPVILTDPLPAGSWHNAESYAAIHTQSTRTAQFGGGASGGIDDRFDFILFSQDVVTGSNGVNYIPNSCHTFGNDGLHFNQSLLDAPQSTTLPDSVIQALYYMSDHLPISCLISVDNPIPPLTRYLDIRLFLEGSFADGLMQSTGTFTIPAYQPYNGLPWNYGGSEMLTSAQGSGIVDWVLVEIRETPGDASTALSSTGIWQKACLLKNNGQLVTADQVNFPVLNAPASENLYVVIRHRNHLDMMSALPMIQNNDSATYWFYDSPDKTFGGMSGIKPLQTEIWGMATGDADANGLIDSTDLKNAWRIQVGSKGYLPADVNFDYEVSNTDKNEKWIENLGKQSVIPD